eukprot:TRINITY_DN8810_c0_g1_i1.p1 TRINITY_DN8810_c0_g1~~TRINITY_DN8810_c0_g1_i1.p1  ORF type:complete len:330 (+),score=31.82 TRINITY_DN8810_c0_g1_i1:79-1068(+)
MERTVPQDTMSIQWPPPPLTEPESVAFLVGAAAFALVATAAAWALCTSGGRLTATGASPMVMGMSMRRWLIIGILAASCGRCIALAAQWALEDKEASFPPGLPDGVMWWTLELVEMFPGVLFLSAFSVIVMFWAQLHYTTIMVSLPLMDCLFVCINVAAYVLLLAIALCTLLLKVYAYVRTYIACVLGGLHVVLALSLFYYGLVVLSELSETSRKKLPGKRLGLRVALLSVVCPAGLFARGVYYLAFSMCAHVMWDRRINLILCIVSELVPSGPGGARALGAITDPFDDSTDSEAPLLDDESAQPRGSVSGTPGFRWKQLYPQPSQNES